MHLSLTTLIKPIIHVILHSVYAADCFLTCHESCIKSIICPLGKKSDDRLMGIFDSEVNNMFDYNYLTLGFRLYKTIKKKKQ